MAKKRKKIPKKRKFNMRLVIIGVISGVFASLSLMCIPCIMAAYPSIAIFFAFLVALSVLLVRYNFVLLALAVLLLAVGLLLNFSRKKKCE